jgi:hypothetical protein
MAFPVLSRKADSRSKHLLLEPVAWVAIIGLPYRQQEQVNPTIQMANSTLPMIKRIHNKEYIQTNKNVHPLTEIPVALDQV